MKKKILLMLAVMAMLVCVFAISVSAVNATSENVLGKYDTDPGVDPVTHRVTADVSFDLAPYFTRTSNNNNVILGDKTTKSVLYDSVTNGYYVFESIYITQDMVKFEYYVSDLNTAIAEYATANSVETYPQFSMAGTWGSRGINEVVHYQMPEGVTKLDGSHCRLMNNKLMKTVWVASTITSFNTHIFGQNPSLEYIYNFENTNLSDGTTFNNLFENSPNLKEVKFPNITATIQNLGQIYGTTNTSLAQDRMFRIYIPNDNYTLASNFYQQDGNLGKFEFVYCGQDYKTFLANNTVLADVTVASSKDYTLGAFTNKYNFICDYSYCDGYLNGVHTSDDEKSNACVTICKDCLKTTINHVGESVTTIYYPTFDTVGTKTVACTNEGCTHSETTEMLPLFKNKGYSAAEYEGGGMSIGFKVDKDAILAYEEATGEKVNYGVFAVLADVIKTNDIFDADGKALDGVIAADITDTDFDIFNLKIVGFTGEQIDTDIAMGAYVGTTKDGATEYAYLQDVTAEKNDKYYFASYNDVKAILDAKNEESAQ